MEANIKVYNVTVPITRSALTLRICGDFHYGIAGVEKDNIERVLKNEQDQHRGNQFIIYTGDIVENNLNSSVGHGYDIAIRDPADQVKEMKSTLISLQQHLYGRNEFKKIQASGSNVLSAGVIGNHEYRSRMTAGIWLQEQMYNPSKIMDMKIQGLLNLKIVNRKLKLEKTYKIFISHRPSNSNAASSEYVMRAAKKKKGDVSADIYVYGHYHRRLIIPDGMYNENGRFKKILYVVNPSPIAYVEYADWAGFSPLDSAYYVNVFLPLDSQMYPWGKI